MKLTKRKALTICWELWTWQANNSHLNKEDWPGWDKYGNMAADCPCCEYHIRITKQKSRTGWKCENNYEPVPGHPCLLHKLWPDGCQKGDSPFSYWDSGMDEEQNAKKIAEFVKAELDKLPPLKEKKNG